MIGKHLGSYQILDKLGEGGMGEVYRARDTRLGRDVAIKVLSPSFVNNPERIARFQREAQILAALNHPHIGAIHGLEHADDAQYLVLELVEGGTLADRLAARGRSGGLPFADAIAIARQIADALEAAHEKGVVHRDLKPANIAVTTDNQVKVLDFGLARIDVPEASRAGDLAESPTLTFAGTQAGVILGTAAYMSPEQAKGRVADKRTDVWGFGCVLYEMLTGRRAFDGEDATEVIAAVVRSEPDWTMLPPEVPASIRLLLKRCLEKDRRVRISDIAVARFVLAESFDIAAEADSTAEGTLRTRRSGRRIAIVASLGLLTGALAASGLWWTFQKPPDERRAVPIRLSLVAPSDASRAAFSSDREIAFSPDGLRIAYRADRAIAMQDLRELEPHVVAGTLTGRMPFFSSDGRWIGFFTPSEIRKVPVAGGVAVTLATIGSPPRGAVWTKDDTIIFSLSDGGGLRRISAASGGEVTVIAQPVESQTSFNYPSLLPNGRGLLFSQGSVGGPVTTVSVLDLQTGARKELIQGGASAQYANGLLVYAVDRNLLAVPFDEERLAITGESMPVLENVMTFPAGTANFALSPNGSIAYAPSVEDVITPRTLVWVDRRGRETPLNAQPRSYTAARISPDGTRIALDIRDQQNDIWTWDIRREVMTRVTLDPTVDMCPVWTPDSKRIVWASLRATSIPVIFSQAADGTGASNRVGSMITPVFPTSMTANGQAIIWENTARNSQDILSLDLSTQKTTPLIATPASELDGDLSSDGRWLAYQSNESGRFDIYVRPFPDVAAARLQISTMGGTRPAWSPNGDEIFYIDASGGLTAVGVERSGSTLVAGRPQQLFATKYHPGFTSLGLDVRGYDIARDGQRFLMIKEAPTPTVEARRMIVILNWTEELRDRLLRR